MKVSSSASPRPYRAVRADAPADLNPATAEAHCIAIAAEHPASLILARTIVNNAAALFAHTKPGLGGELAMLRAGFPIVGGGLADQTVIEPNYAMIDSVGWNGPAIWKVLESGTFTETTALLTSFLYSSELSELLDLIDVSADSTSTLREWLDLGYPGLAEQENSPSPTRETPSRCLQRLPADGWLGQQRESRRGLWGDGRPSHTVANAHELRAAGHMSEREFRFQRSNPLNAGASSDTEVLAMRHHGRLIFEVVADSKFGTAAAHHRHPVLTGPSGTAYPLMTLSRLLMPAAAREALAIDEQQCLELIRFMCYGYLGASEHHSMIEVNLGVAPHGLPEQWGDGLYRAPFSMPIEARASPSTIRFSASNPSAPKAEKTN